MTPDKETRAATAAVDRYAALALRRDVSLGVLLSTHPRDFDVLLSAAAQGFPKGCLFSEREVNDLLRAFLGDAGSMLATDHVELRRWLVDFHVLDRDGFARAARDEEAARRAQRKERWQKAQRDAHG
jgi:hypothetical protein